MVAISARDCKNENTNFLNFQNETGEGEGSSSNKMKAIAASSIKLPSMGAWDLPNSKSPALYAPPDMNSKYFHIEEGNISMGAWDLLTQQIHFLNTVST